MRDRGLKTIPLDGQHVRAVTSVTRLNNVRRAGARLGLGLNSDRLQVHGRGQLADSPVLSGRGGLRWIRVHETCSFDVPDRLGVRLVLAMVITGHEVEPTRVNPGSAIGPDGSFD